MCTGTHPFIPAEHVVEVIMRMTWDEQRVENVMHVKDNLGDPDETRLMLLASTFSDFYDHILSPQLAATVLGVEVQCTNLTTEFGARFTDTTIAGTAGGSSSPPLPNNVSWKMNFPAGVRGQHAGGIYLIGLTEAFVDGNEITTSAAGVFTTMYNNLQLALVAEGFTFATISLCHDNAWRTSAAVFPLGGTIGYRDLVIDSQRRRLPGRGR